MLEIFPRWETALFRMGRGKKGYIEEDLSREKYAKDL